MTIKHLLLSSSVCLAMLTVAPLARAIPIDLGQTTGSPASPSDELPRLNVQITSYNLSHDPDLQLGVLAGNSGNILTGSGGVSINLDVTGWDYLMLKWADTDQFYYVGGDNGTLTFNSTVFNGHGNPQALSHYTFFSPDSHSGGGGNPVPDGGSTMVLLGGAMSGLGLVVRRIKK